MRESTRFSLKGDWGREIFPNPEKKREEINNSPTTTITTQKKEEKSRLHHKSSLIGTHFMGRTDRPKDFSLLFWVVVVVLLFLTLYGEVRGLDGRQ